LGYKHVRPKTKEQKEREQLKSDLLDAQELTASLYEQNQKLNNSLLDTQDLIAQFVEKGGVV
jgi:hypothetical protein